jgi:hypothetical protein
VVVVVVIGIAFVIAAAVAVNVNLNVVAVIVDVDIIVAKYLHLYFYCFSLRFLTLLIDMAIVFAVVVGFVFFAILAFLPPIDAVSRPSIAGQLLPSSAGSRLQWNAAFAPFQGFIADGC